MTSKQTSEHEALSFASENFAKLFEEYEKDSQQLVEGTVVKGVIVGIFDKGVAIDIGGKSVGFIDIAEFRLDGKIIGRVKGGYAADVNGITCFLPRSQVDTMLLSDDSFLIGKIEKLQVL